MTVNVPVSHPLSAAMPRPPFALTDDQARRLAQQVASLQETYPFDQRNHRPFVRAFLRAVLEVTGELYSPAIYQRLLGAYAPERRPSTATLAAEKQVLAGEVAVRPALAAADGPGPASLPLPDATQLHALMSDAIDAALARASRFGAGGSAQSEFYAARLRETERDLLTVRGEAARLAAELAVAREAAAQHEEETRRLHGTVQHQADTLSKMTSEVAEMRKFALLAIDEARGETRVWKERAAGIEAQRQMDARLLETFRQQAYRAGGAIPDVLRQEKPR